MSPATPSPPFAEPPEPPRPARILVIDWLRGLAVVLMIFAHGADAWVRPDARTGAAWEIVAHLSGIPSRLFLFLVGVSAAIKFESRLAKGVASALVRAETAKRGLVVIGLAYVFRFQEWALSGFWNGPSELARVDILNCIGASLVLLGLVAVPRVTPGSRGAAERGAAKVRPRIALALGAAATFVALGPIVGPARFPDWLPRPLTSYVGGQRPMAWFTLFPWAAWPFVGLAIGHLWLRFGRTPRGQAFTFLVSGALGALTTAAVVLVRRLDPQIIRYPSHLVQQVGPGAFFQRLGVIGVIAALGHVVTRLAGDRHSPLRQLGQTSLLIYWVHIELCYGHLAHPLKRRLDLPQALGAIAALTLAMYGLSLFKTRHEDRLGRWARGLATSRVRSFPFA